MSFDVLKFLKDHNIQHSTDHHHCSPGWVQVHCPFCGGNNFHLGLPLQNARIGNCWRCGKHSLFSIIKDLLHCKNSEVYSILEKYQTEASLRWGKVSHKVQASSMKYPPGTGQLGEPHKQYLVNRGFDPAELIRTWGLLGTGPIGPYKHRIIIPIYYEGQMVSYTSRDITGKSDLRYKTCSRDREVRSHKHCLYGLDTITDTEWVLVVEGPTDVWQLGAGVAVATFGITWTKEQVLLLSRFRNISILYDAEPQAQEQARSLAQELNWIGVENIEVINQDIAKDPGSMKKEIVKELLEKLH